MSSFTPSRVQINSETLQLMEAISRKQGVLSVQRHSMQDHTQLESVAAIDAVHFSTKIEGNVLTRDQVTRALESKSKAPVSSRDLREVLNYSRARKMAREWSLKKKPFNDSWVTVHHAELLKGIVKGKLRGHYRQAQCVIKDSRTNVVIYMAPDWNEVSLLMAGLLKWLRKQIQAGSSPLLLAAQFHFEFVTIHPFMDGNGRLARLLTNGILLGSGYDVELYAALEKQHERDRKSYYRALRSLQSANFYDIPSEQDIGPWIIYWLKCLLATYEEALGRLAGDASMAPGQIEMADGIPLAQEQRLRKAIPLFLRHSKLRASEYASIVGLARTQAVADLKMLVEMDILERIGGGRSTLYRIRKEKI